MVVSLIMKKDFTKYIKKIILVKGKKYILFIPDNVLPEREVRMLSDELNRLGFSDVLFVISGTTRGVKVIEK